MKKVIYRNNLIGVTMLILASLFIQCNLDLGSEVKVKREMEEAAEAVEPKRQRNEEIQKPSPTLHTLEQLASAKQEKTDLAISHQDTVSDKSLSIINIPIKKEAEIDSLLPITDKMIDRAKTGNAQMMKYMSKDKYDENIAFLVAQLERLKRGEKIEEMIRLIFKVIELGGNSDILQAVLERSRDLKNRLNTLCNTAAYNPLYVAAMYGHVEIVKMLLVFGADPNALTYNTQLPLEAAIKNGHEEARQLLVAAGADTTLQGNLTSLLFKAIEGGYDNKVIQNLLEKGADMEAKDMHGWTPLHVAASCGRKKIVELLLAKGANLKSKTKDGITPLRLAAKNGMDRVVELILTKVVDKDAPYTNVNWLEDAAKQGDESALNVLRIMAQRGKGLRKDLIQGKYWTLISETSLGGLGARFQSQDLFNKCLSYVGPEGMCSARRLNKAFYTYVTGYTKSGQLGMNENVLPPPRYTEDWGLNTVTINFKNTKDLTPDNIPSLVWYQLTGKVRYIPQAFVPYIIGTQINSVDFSNIQVSPHKIPKELEILEGATLPILNLSNNDISVDEIRCIAEKLKNITIDTLDLSANYLNNQALGYLSSYLKDLNIRVLDLSTHYIVYPDSDQYFIEKYLCEGLQHSKISIIYLRDAKIGQTEREFLRKKCPKIRWIFE